MNHFTPTKRHDKQTHFILWIKNHKPIFRLFVIILSLIIIILLIPVHIRKYFWNGLVNQKFLGIMILSFCFLAFTLILSAGQRLDTWFFQLLNIRGRRPKWMDHVMVGLTQLGHAFTTFGFAILLLLLGKPIFAYKLILGSITLWLLVELLKLIIHRSRPFVRISQTRIVGGKAIGRSFPSGHTSQVFFTAGLMIQGFEFPLLATLGLYGLALLVGITRIYVGAHYPRDILAGAILGSAWAVLWGLVDHFFFIGLS